LATFNGKDSLVYAGTGSGKTLPIALNILLEDPAKKLVTITISPLKRLQITQVYSSHPRISILTTYNFLEQNDFNEKFRIPTLAVNETTSRDEGFWNVGLIRALRSSWNSCRSIIRSSRGELRGTERF